MQSSTSMINRTSARLGACLISSLLFATACDDGDDVDFEDEATDAVEEGRASGNSLAEMTNEDLAGQNEIVALETAAEILLTIDEGEILQADTALDRVTLVVVADYAQRMIDEHSAHQELVSQTFANLEITPRENRVAAQLSIEALAGLHDLELTEDPDLFYISMQVSMHEEASIIVDNLMEHVDSPVVDRLLEDTRDMLDEHRDAAIEIMRSF